MLKEYKKISIHQKLEYLINDLVDNELPLREALKEFEMLYIEAARKRYNGNKTRMAKALGIHRNTLHNLCKALDLE